MAVVLLVNLPLPAVRRLRSAARDGAEPVQTLLGFVAERARAEVGFLFQARRVLREESRIRDELARLRRETRELALLEDENRELRRQLAFRADTPREMLMARVVSRGGMSGWWQTVQINRGRDDGVEEDLAVVAVDGLVGRVTAVATHTADVLLISDPTCRVSCRLPRSGALGILRGVGVDLAGRSGLDLSCMPPAFRVDYVEQSQDVREGDEVVTSGLGGTYPEGLLVGVVSEAGAGRDGLFRPVSVRPAADLGRLRYVWVVKR